MKKIKKIISFIFSSKITTYATTFIGFLISFIFVWHIISEYDWTQIINNFKVASPLYLLLSLITFLLARLLLAYRWSILFVNIDLPLNTLSISGNSIIYNSEHDIGGFQFNIKDAMINKASGGDAENSDFTTSFGKNVILGFSFEGKVIPSGCGVLVNLETDQIPSGIDKIIISSIKGEELSFKYYKQ